MAYSFIGSGVSSATAGGTTRTITYSPTIGNTLIAVAMTDTLGSNLVINDGANIYTYISSITSGSSYLNLFSAPVTGSTSTISLTKSGGGGNLYGFYVAEYSGLSSNAYIVSSFQSQYQNGPGSGANLLTTTANPNITSVPAMLWAFTCDFSQLAGGANVGVPAAGTSLSYNSRAVAWVSGGAANSAVAEDIRITSTGTNPATFTAGSALQFDQFFTIAAAFLEAAPSPIIQSASSPFSSADPWSGGHVSVSLSGVTAGNAILIVTPAVINTTGSPTLTITDSVNSVTDLEQLASFGLSSVYSILDFSIIPNASAGAHTLTATVGSGTGYGFIVAAEISGLNSSAGLDVFSLNSAGGGSNPSTGNTGTPASTAEIAIAAVSGYITGAVTIGEPSGYTNIAKYQAGGGYVQYSVDYLSPVALAAQLASWTGLTSVNSYVAGVIVLKAASNQATVMWWS